LKLAVEIDGDIHDLPSQKEHDATRQKYLKGFGIKIIRITNDELFLNAEKAFKQIEEEIKIEKRNGSV
jgi:very-short-patch-repair endonuclease